MRYFLILFGLILLTSCGSYRIQQRGPEITHVLAVTSKGDTIQVSTDYLQREFRTNPGTYSNWRFQWDNSWYYGYGWFNYYNPYFYNPRFYYPQRPIIIQRPKVVTPQPRTWRYRTNIDQRRSGSSPQPSRGRSNVQPRQNTPRVQPQQPRPTRQTVPSRSNNQQPPRTRGGAIIKQ